MKNSGLKVEFRKDTAKKVDDCKMKLNIKQAKMLASAIKDKYWYQMYLDDLPLWGMVGEYLPLSSKTGEHVHLNLMNVVDEHFDYDYLSGKEIQTYPHMFTHKSFSISYNGNRIIQVNLTSENPILIAVPKDDSEPLELKMTYSVTWIKTDIDYHKRFDRYLDFQFFEHQIHWFALFNSFMLVIFLVGMVTMVLLRALKKDYERMSIADTTALNNNNNIGNDIEDINYNELIEETGWKKLHGDIFRKPENLTIFCAIIGTGYQIYCSLLLVILLAISGKVYDARGTIATAFVVTYCLTSLISGYTSSMTFLEYCGIDSPKKDSDWKITMILTGILFPSIIFMIIFFLNILSLSYKSTNAITFGTFIVMLIIWFISLILLLLGTLASRYSFIYKKKICPVNKNFIRPLPSDKAWYMNPIIFCSSVGILPFGSIFIEMYYIFNSFWNYKFYYVFGFMFLVFIILTIVTMCVTIVSTYLLLNTEDYRWKWFSIFSGGSTALYVFLYSMFYFYTKTQMNGFFQTSFYFGYMFLFSLSIFFMCGTIGFVGTQLFIKRIYKNIKIE